MLICACAREMYMFMYIFFLVCASAVVRALNLQVAQANTSRLHARSQSSTFIFMNGELAQTTYTNFTVFVDDALIVRDPPEELKNSSFMFR